MSFRSGWSRLISWCCIMGFIVLPAALAADTAQRPVTAGDRAAVIAKVSEVFRHFYPDTALTAKMLARLQQEEAAGAYDGLEDMAAFTSQLTRNMRSVSQDDHITVWPYEKLPEDLASETRLGSPDDNYGFKRVELLPGNIGYIKLTSFSNPREAGPTAVAAMNFVGHCDALIFDLRSNGGGDEIMARFLSSYLFGERTHMVDEQVPSENRVQQSWTLEWVPGPRLTDVPVFVLVNRLSYSSSEHLAFALQQAGRALVVGERTRGGAHAVRYMSFPEVGVNIRVPYTTTVKPGTDVSWVGGVVPDIPASSEKAAAAAEVRAVTGLLAGEQDEGKRFALQWALDGYRAELDPVVLDEAALAGYAGTYGSSKVSSECGRLELQREGRRKRTLVPMGNDDFMFLDPELAHYRVRFTRDDANRVVAMFIHDGDGDSYPPMQRVE